MTLSIVGLLLLKHFKSLRALLFYTHLEEYQLDEATDIYIVDKEKNEEICHVLSESLHNKKSKVFKFKYLKYEMKDRTPVPLALHY